MGGFFYRTEQEINRLGQIEIELASIGSKLAKYDKGFRTHIPREFDLENFFFRISDGNPEVENFLKINCGRVQIMERVLFRQLKTLNEFESSEG